jgi:hypothetical protein
MALARLFWTVDTAISHLPDLLAQLAAAGLFTLLVVSYSYLALIGLNGQASRRGSTPTA